MASEAGFFPRTSSFRTRPLQNWLLGTTAESFALREREALSKGFLIMTSETDLAPASRTSYDADS
jgi:hypothetical protein